MNIAFYNGVSGLVAYQQEMDLVSNNVANVNTVGYKPSRASFSDLLYTQMWTNTDALVNAGGDAGAQDTADENGVGGMTDADGIHMQGHGVRLAYSDLVFRQGNLLQTEHPLDMAIKGDGFFAVERANGTTEYTRNGAFDISIEGKSGYLVTSDGSYVLDASGKRIKLERGDDDQFDLTNLQDEVGVYIFPNPYGLEPNTGGFRETPISGTPAGIKASSRASRPYTIVTGMLEQSAVDLSEEMANIIVSQRAFQFSAKMVQTADEIEDSVNNLR